MRTIKFRAWDKEKKIMIELGDIFNCFAADNYINGLTENKVEIMQYVGILDNNGVTVYEGDIISRGGSIFTVHFGKCGFGMSRIDSNGSFANSFDFDYNGKEKGEIIGNIYENPELITK